MTQIARPADNLSLRDYAAGLDLVSAQRAADGTLYEIGAGRGTEPQTFGDLDAATSAAAQIAAEVGQSAYIHDTVDRRNIRRVDPDGSAHPMPGGR